MFSLQIFEVRAFSIIQSFLSSHSREFIRRFFCFRSSRCFSSVRREASTVAGIRTLNKSCNAWVCIGWPVSLFSSLSHFSIPGNFFYSSTFFLFVVARTMKNCLLCVWSFLWFFSGFWILLEKLKVVVRCYSRFSGGWLSHHFKYSHNNNSKTLKNEIITF